MGLERLHKNNGRVTCGSASGEVGGRPTVRESVSSLLSLPYVHTFFWLFSPSTLPLVLKITHKLSSSITWYSTNRNKNTKKRMTYIINRLHWLDSRSEYTEVQYLTTVLLITTVFTVTNKITSVFWGAAAVFSVQRDSCRIWVIMKTHKWPFAVMLTESKTWTSHHNANTVR